MFRLDGVMLNTLAKKITKVPTGLGVPERRGENVVVPFSDGSRYVKKYLGERTISLVMLVQGASKFDALNTLLGKEGIRLFEMKVGEEWRSIACELRNRMYYDVVVLPKIAWISIDLVCPDPLFYGGEVEVVIPLTETEHNITLVNPGTATTRRVTMEISGITSTLEINNETTDCKLRYGNTTIAGEVLEVKSPENTAIRNIGGEEENRVGLFTHAGDPAFMVLAPGDNELEITTEEVPDAMLTFKFYTPYF